MPDYILKVNRPDERYCNGCPLKTLSGKCMLTKTYPALVKDSFIVITPPNCPLAKIGVDWGDSDSTTVVCKVEGK